MPRMWRSEAMTVSAAPASPAISTVRMSLGWARSLAGVPAGTLGCSAVGHTTSILPAFPGSTLGVKHMLSDLGKNQP